MGGLTNFPNGVSSFGIPLVGGSVPSAAGDYWFVDPTYGADGNNGKSFAQAFLTLDRVMDFVGSGDVVCMAQGSYDETLTISRASNLPDGLTFVGCGNPGAVAIAPTSTNATGVVNDCDDVTFINVGMAGVGTGNGLTNTGSRLRLFNCKLENDDGTGICFNTSPGTAAQHTAQTKGTGGDISVVGCEFAWAATGIKMLGTDYGATTELNIQGCRFHDLATAHITEGVGSGGSAAVTFASLRILGNTFGKAEAGTNPTKFISLNASNSNTGVIYGNYFPVATNSGLNLVSTAALWVGNYLTGGISTGQPS